jgi:hypothetical protein
VSTTEEVYEREMAKLRQKQSAANAANAAAAGRRLNWSATCFMTPTRRSSGRNATVDCGLTTPMSPVDNVQSSVKLLTTGFAEADVRDASFYSPMSTPRSLPLAGDAGFRSVSPLSLPPDGVDGATVRDAGSARSTAMYGKQDMVPPVAVPVPAPARCGSVRSGVTSSSGRGVGGPSHRAPSVGGSSRGRRTAWDGTSSVHRTGMTLQQADEFYARQTEWLKVKREHDQQMADKLERARHTGVTGTRSQRAVVVDPDAYFQSEMEAQRRKQERWVAGHSCARTHARC